MEKVQDMKKEELGTVPALSLPVSLTLADL